MANNVIAKIKLAPLTPYWRDRLNFFMLKKDEIFSITDDMQMESIREGIAKGYIQLVEGNLPLDTDNTDYLSKGEAAQMINDAVGNIVHPECNISDEEKADIFDRISALEDGSTSNPDSGTTDPEPESPTPEDPDPDTETEDPFGDYEWKEVYVMTQATKNIDITGSKMIDDFNNSGGDDGPFWDDYAAFKYNLYAPRLASKSGVPTTEADDNPNTLIPIYELGQTQGSDLASISPSLDGVDWQWLGEGHNYIDLGIVPTTLVVFYLIKSK